jgi:hypothetical protein
MDFALGLFSPLKVKSKRSFNFRYEDATIFPLTFDSLSGLGYEYGVVNGGRCREAFVTSWMFRPALFFQKLCQAKTEILEELCSQSRATASPRL